MSRADGYFQAYVNRQAYRRSADDKELMSLVTRCAQATFARAQVRWAGSQRKGTAVQTSDLDVCVETSSPVSVAERRAFRSALERGVGRPVRVLSHAVRIDSSTTQRRMDIAFANAAFGSRPLPDLSEWHNRQSRQTAARALKVWARAARLPTPAGWVVEALVVHLDQGARSRTSLDLFLHIVEWLATKSTPQAIEGIARPLAHPRWGHEWTSRLTGPVQAYADQARALQSRAPAPHQWGHPDDVGRWLGQ